MYVKNRIEHAAVYLCTLESILTTFITRNVDKKRKNSIFTMYNVMYTVEYRYL